MAKQVTLKLIEGGLDTPGLSAFERAQVASRSPERFTVRRNAVRPRLTRGRLALFGCVMTMILTAPIVTDGLLNG